MAKWVGYTKSKKKTFPTKTTMNLYYKEEVSTKVSTWMLYVLFALVVLLAFAKFSFFDVREQLVDANQSLGETQSQLAGIQAELKDYNTVDRQYMIYSYGYLTGDDSSLADRLDILQMVESKLMDKAQISSLSISGNTVTVNFSSITLKTAASIVKDLKTSSMVTNVTVDTAASDAGSQSATMVITVQKEGGTGE